MCLVALNAMGNMTEDLDNQLLEHALAIRSNAYAPYSNFAVGAAVLTENGEIVTGTNVENCSYGATVCAERVAIWTAAALGARKISVVAIALDGPMPVPCGVCRQVMAEFGVMRILATNLQGAKFEWTLEELYPHPFNPESLSGSS